jgi:hypothetical protein
MLLIYKNDGTVGVNAVHFLFKGDSTTFAKF